MKKNSIKVGEKHFFNRKHILIASIGLVSLAVLVTLGILWQVYHNDKPKFIPEETRKDVRGDIKENVAGNLKKIWNGGGKALENAAFDDSTGQGSGTQPGVETKTFKSEEFGFEIEYDSTLFMPNVVNQPLDSYLGTVEFLDRQSFEASYDIDIFENTEMSAQDWVEKLSSETETITDISPVTFNGGGFVKATETGDPDHLIFVTATKSFIYKFKVLFENEDVLKEALKTTRFN